MPLTPYSGYQHSRVPSLGELPEHWVVTRLRNAAGIRFSNVDKLAKEGESPIRLCNYVDVYKNDRIRDNMTFMTATASSEEVDHFRLSPGDVLITKDSEMWNDIGVPAFVITSSDDLLCGYHLALLRPSRTRLLGRYLFRALQSTCVAYQLHIEANGVTRYGLSQGAIKSVWIPLPSIPEQAAIAEYLDYVDRRIRPYIRSKKKLITLLDEERQAIIHRYVTRGLDPDVRPKPSGVGWLGEVPEHWEIQRNGRLFAERTEVGFAHLPILEVSLKTGVRVRDFDASDRKQVMSDRSKYKRAVKGDIAYNTMRMWQGAVGVAPVDGLVSPAYVVARPRSGTEPRYYGYLFRVPAYMGEVDCYSRGIVKDRNRLYWEDFKQMPSPCPPFVEQVEIANAINRDTSAIDKAIDAAHREIVLINEYRTRLIADVVTGKLDVRAVGASLPDENSQEDARLEETESITEYDPEEDDSNPEAESEELDA